MFIIGFSVRNSYGFSLRSQNDLVIPSVNSVKIHWSVIWNSVPNEIRNSDTLSF